MSSSRPLIDAAGAAALAATCVLMGAWVHAASSSGGPFEAPPTFKAADVLPPTLVEGPLHRIEEPVRNDGYFYVYRITSPELGIFEAVSTRMLGIRVTEIGALEKLKQANEAAILAGGAVDAFGDLFTGAAKVVVNPVETVKGIPEGVNRLFGFAGRTMTRAGEKVDASKEAAAASGQGSSPGKTVAGGAGTAARAALGVNAAQRKWAQTLGVDPYTTNELLAKAIDRAAKLEATGRFSTNLVPGGAVLTAVSAAANVHDLVYKDWDEVERLNEQRLTAMGVGVKTSRLFRLNPVYSPTRQTRLIAALDSLRGVPGRAAFVERANRARFESQAQLFQEAAELMEVFHRSQAPLLRLLPEADGAGALAQGNRVVQLLPVDHMVWTDDLAGHVERVTRHAQTLSPTSREVWLTGRVSDRVRNELRTRGWTVHERGLQLDPRWP
jgi:hypothetical protein